MLLLTNVKLEKSDRITSNSKVGFPGFGVSVCWSCTSGLPSVCSLCYARHLQKIEIPENFIALCKSSLDRVLLCQGHPHFDFFLPSVAENCREQVMANLRTSFRFFQQARFPAPTIDLAWRAGTQNSKRYMCTVVFFGDAVK